MNSCATASSRSTSSSSCAPPGWSARAWFRTGTSSSTTRPWPTSSWRRWSRWRPRPPGRWSGLAWHACRSPRCLSWASTGSPGSSRGRSSRRSRRWRSPRCRPSSPARSRCVRICSPRRPLSGRPCCSPVPAREICGGRSPLGSCSPLLCSRLRRRRTTCGGCRWRRSSCPDSNEAASAGAGSPPHLRWPRWRRVDSPSSSGSRRSALGRPSTTRTSSSPCGGRRAAGGSRPLAISSPRSQGPRFGAPSSSSAS